MPTVALALPRDCWQVPVARVAEERIWRRFGVWLVASQTCLSGSTPRIPYSSVPGFRSIGLVS